VTDASHIVIAGGPVTTTSRLLVTLDRFGLGPHGPSSNNQPRPGRIPAAGNVPFHWLTGSLGRFRERRGLERLFAQAGVRQGDTVVTDCPIGIQACVAARSLGCEVAPYDGSFEDWSRRAALPIEAGPPVAR
jgi:3-mercaptopyruvate sulfurtransferase SseA